MIRLAWGIAAAFSLTSQCGAAQENADAKNAEAKKVALQCAASVMRVEHWRGKAQARQGILTGFFVAAPSDRVLWVMTVLPDWEDGDVFRVEFQDVVRDSKLVARDPTLWLAILEMDAFEGAGPPLEFAQAIPECEEACYLVDAAHVGAEEPGRARCAGRDMEAGPISLILAHLSQTDSCAGSPLLDGKGRVVGAICRSLENPNTALAIPCPALTKAWSDATKFGEFTRPWVGLQFDTSSSATSVAGVVQGSPSHLAGIKSGDLILRLADEPVACKKTLADILHTLTPDVEVKIKVLRGLEEVELGITPRHRAE